MALVNYSIVPLKRAAGNARFHILGIGRAVFSGPPIPGRLATLAHPNIWSYSNTMGTGSRPPFDAPLHSSKADDDGFTRLHITPFDPDLQKVVLPSSISQAARNISFHTLETFPEKPFGFVELPHMEAEKLKKKLNGATLKGTKVRIETARPEQYAPDEATEKSKAKDSAKEKKERTRKRKRGIDVLEGVKLEDRKVKRGWTETPEEASKKPKRSKEYNDKEKRKNKVKDEDTDKSEEKKKDGHAKQQRKRIKSKYTEEAECLLNTKIPPNAVKNLTASESASKRKKKDKTRQVTIHEFEKTTKFPSFLRTGPSADDAPVAVEFVEDKGWVDAEGNVVETVKAPAKPVVKRKKKTKAEAPQSSPPASPEKSPSEDSDDTSSSGSSSEDDDESESSDEASSVSLPSSTAPQQAAPDAAASSEKGRPMSSSSARSLSIKIPPPITPSSNKVHPLEALYKRAKPNDAVTETPAQEQPFSFFGGGGAGEEEEEASSSQPAMPMTPFTRQDMEWRNVRSAAPTPDTAHPSKVRNFWATLNEDEQPAGPLVAADDVVDDLREEEEEEEPTASNSGAQAKSEFQSWFWENRRDLNRSWMKRRKASAKEKRHRDNKARASRVF